MKEFISKAIKWILPSMDMTNAGGASAKKLSAFWAVMIGTIPQLIWLKYAYYNHDFSLLLGVIGLDFGFAAGALGMTVYQSLKTTPNGNGNGESEKTLQ